MTIDRLKNFNVDATDIDELVAISAFARSLAAEYEANTLEKPEWLETKSAELKREINGRQADARAKKIKEIKLKLGTLKTAEEKRNELNAELARLEGVTA